MEQWQRKGIRVALFLLFSAVFVAAAAFLIYAIIAAPPDTSQSKVTQPEQVVEINGRPITLSIDPEKAVVFSEAPQATGVPVQVQESASEIEAVATQIVVEPTPVPTATPIPSQVVFIDYVVKPGDSLYSIGSELNSSIELLAINGIDSGDLVAGSVIRVPVANPAFCPGSRAYVVRDRDTIYGIALSLNSTTEAIMLANNFPAGYFIKATEVICVPYS
jgi:LysM repeat protein